MSKIQRTYPPDPLQGIDFSAFARQFRDGVLTAEMLTRSYLERIAALDPVIGAFRAVDESAALRRARDVDLQRSAGHDLGPLMGLPVAVKEIFSVDGLPFGAGTDIDIDSLRPAQGPFVDALLRQGCVVLGVTKTTEFAASTINSSKSMPWNPWDAQTMRVCGGSSHGSAAALAAGLCAFAIGSDTGGSVRLPAALCGLVGFKPSLGTWSTDGVFPLSPTFDTVGTFAHSVADTRAVFAALANPTGTGTAAALALPALSDLRVGRVTNFFDDLDPPVAKATARVMATLADAGVRFVDIDLPEVAEIASVFGRILAGELVHYLGRQRLLAQHHKIDPVPWARVAVELDIDTATLEALRGRQQQLVASIGQRIGALDAIIGPTTPLSPGPVAGAAETDSAIAWNRRSGLNTRPGNLFGLCGISLPVHAPDELPVGLQLLCRGARDAHLLAIAAQFEKLLGRGTRPDLAAFD